MRGLQKSKRLSWAPDVSLCQVRLFLSEDPPSQVGLGAQDHLQAKSTSHSSGPSDDTLPPGFGGGHPSNKSQIKLSEIPVIKWKYPTRLLLLMEWRVVSGEESQEIVVQNQREMRVLEAFYPCASVIPQNPSIAADIEASHHDDSQTPPIPITPIEDEDILTDSPYDAMQQLVPASSQSSVTPSALETPLKADPGLVAAALSAITKGNEHGNVVDHELLIKILSNPKLVENLLANHAQCSTENLTSVSNLIPSTSHQPPPVTLPHPSKPPPVASVSSGQCYPQSNGTHVPPGFDPPLHSSGVPQAKDMNYYKNLIQQHGGDRPELTPPQQFNFHYNHHVGVNQEHTKNQRPKQKIMKPCIYFNRKSGCRNGSNCMYLHDASSQQRTSNNHSSNAEIQSTKRVKMDREISS